MDCQNPSPLPRDVMEAMSVITDDGFCLCEMVVDGPENPVDYRFLAVNRFFEEMTGLRDPVGRTALELVPTLERHWIETYARVGLGRERQRFEAGSDAMGRWFDVFATPVEPHGCFTIVFRDVSARKRLEAERAQALDRAQRLLEELNHRVMNSLAVMASIVSMEARAQAGDADALSRITGRLNALSRLYAELNASGSVDLVSMRSYLSRLCAAIAEAVEGSGVTIESNVEDCELPTTQAVSVGLILNELVTNSVKYAFPASGRGTVSVRFSRTGGGYRLVVSDNGAGMGDGETAGSGIGRRLIRAFVEQLGGESAVDTGPAGTSVAITF